MSLHELVQLYELVQGLVPRTRKKVLVRVLKVKISTSDGKSVQSVPPYPEVRESGVMRFPSWTRRTQGRERARRATDAAATDDAAAAAATDDAAAAAAAGAMLALGTQVRGKWRDGGTWYDGRISEITGDTYTINYNDGDIEFHVPRKLIEVREEMEIGPNIATSKQIEVREEKMEDYFGGIIVGVEPSPCGGGGVVYDIDYDEFKGKSFKTKERCVL